MHQKYRLTLVPAPPSKPRDSPLYDSRMGCMLQLLAHQVGVALDIRDCLGFSGAHAASHACSQRPLPNDLYTDLSFDATLGRPEQKPEVIFLFDDMLTTGALYAAMTQKLTQMYPGVEVIGHFIARRVIPNPYMVQTSR